MCTPGRSRTANLSAEGDDANASLNTREPRSRLQSLSLHTLNLTALGRYLHSRHRCALLAQPPPDWAPQLRSMGRTHHKDAASCHRHPAAEVQPPQSRRGACCSSRRTRTAGDHVLPAAELGGWAAGCGSRPRLTTQALGSDRAAAPSLPTRLECLHRRPRGERKHPDSPHQENRKDAQGPVSLSGLPTQCGPNGSGRKPGRRRLPC